MATTAAEGEEAAIAAVFALPLLLAAVLQGVIRRDGMLIVRAAFVQLPAAFLLAAGVEPNTSPRPPSPSSPPASC